MEKKYYVADTYEVTYRTCKWFNSTNKGRFIIVDKFIPMNK